MITLRMPWYLHKNICSLLQGRKVSNRQTTITLASSTFDSLLRWLLPSQGPMRSDQVHKSEAPYLKSDGCAWPADTALRAASMPPRYRP